MNAAFPLNTIVVEWPASGPTGVRVEFPPATLVQVAVTISPLALPSLLLGIAAHLPSFTASRAPARSALARAARHRRHNAATGARAQLQPHGFHARTTS